MKISDRERKIQKLLHPYTDLSDAEYRLKEVEMHISSLNLDFDLDCETALAELENEAESLRELIAEVKRIENLNSREFKE